MKIALLTLLVAAPAQAATFFGEADLGAVIFLGSAGDHADPGPALGARLGFGATPWLSFGARLAGSTHQASVPTPSVGQYFQLYETGVDLRAGGTLGAFGLFVEAGGGWSFISTNILDSVGITEPYRHDGPYLSAGAGLEYHTENPRYAVGVAGDYAVYPELGSMQTLSVRVYLRYTK
jgi:hypothetical protein